MAEKENEFICVNDMNLNIKFNLQNFDENYGTIIIPEPNPFQNYYRNKKIQSDATPKAPPPSPVNNKKKRDCCPFRCCS